MSKVLLSYQRNDVDYSRSVTVCRHHVAGKDAHAVKFGLVCSKCKRKVVSCHSCSQRALYSSASKIWRNVDADIHDRWSWNLNRWSCRKCTKVHAQIEGRDYFQDIIHYTREDAARAERHHYGEQVFEIADPEYYEQTLYIDKRESPEERVEDAKYRLLARTKKKMRRRARVVYDSD